MGDFSPAYPVCTTAIRFVPRGEVIGKVVGAVRIRSGPLLER
ncbi:hypothetical protein OKW35_000284 [Paraburkholderia sp. MM5477-R1]